MIKESVSSCHWAAVTNGLESVTLRTPVGFAERLKLGAPTRTPRSFRAAQLTEPYSKDWPGGHERFVRIAYQELSAR